MLPMPAFILIIVKSYYYLAPQKELLGLAETKTYIDPMIPIKLLFMINEMGRNKIETL